MRRWLQRRRERRAVRYLTGIEAYANECVRKRLEAGILCPQGTPGCPYTDCGPWPGGGCLGSGRDNAAERADAGLMS